MTLEIPLSAEAEKRLRERAKGSGVDVRSCATQILEEALKRPSLDEILAPVRADFARTGMSESEIMELGRSELNALRKEKRSVSP